MKNIKTWLNKIRKEDVRKTNIIKLWQKQELKKKIMINMTLR